MGKSLWKGLVDFAGFSDTTVLWPRWLYLRLLGIVFFFAFAFWCKDGLTLVGPRGLEPIEDYLAFASQEHGWLAAVLYVPTVFWAGAGAGAITAAAWCGLVASLALALNFWPRASLAVCVTLFFSFIAPLTDLCPTLVDPLLIEMSLLALPFAPRGLRPGLGEKSPPHPLAILALRLLAFRVMFESGYGKLASLDPILQDRALLNLMHETAPFPNFLGYLDHQLPAAWHLFQIYFTYVAELGGSILILLGRGPRLVAILFWTALQTTILLTSNFGPLNVLALTLGLVLLDDQRIAGLLKRLPRTRALEPPAPARPADTPLQLAAWSLVWAANAGCGFLLFVFMILRVESGDVPDWLAPIYRTGSIAATYTLYQFIDHYRVLTEFAGTDDYGRTWKPYRYKYVIQDERRLSSLIAPYFPRFDAAIQSYSKPGPPPRIPLFLATARRLLEGDEAVAGLFAENPFAGHPPQAVRISRYRMAFNTWAVYRETGRIWTRTYLDEFSLPLVRDPKTGRISFER